MSSFQVIVLATPVFFLLMGLEFAWGLAREKRGTGRNTYRLNDSINSVSLGVLSQLGGVFSKLFTVGIYAGVYSTVALYPNPEFWNTWYGAVLALVFYDFCYYWLHRGGHEIGVLWAAHVVHHQSQDYNLSTALRQTSSGFLFGWIFYLPMALAGVPPVLFGIVALVDLLYQFWVHTEQIGKLGWFDRVFCSPSNHRVHHAVNDGYLDKNYGGILILWDRLFGSFKEEGVKCVYGTRGQLNSWDPIWANAEVYWALAKDSWHAGSWADKLRVWVKPPGWRPADVASRFPKPQFELARVTKFDPVLSRGTQWFAGLQFMAFLQGVTAVLWFARDLPVTTCAIWSAVLVIGYWCIGAVLQGRLTALGALMIEAGALATAASTLGLMELHYVAKPAAMLFAIFFIARCRYSIDAGSTFYRYLLLALVACLAGDVLLMLPGNLFIPGLASFLVGHVFYFAAFRQGVPLLPSRIALVLTLGVGISMYSILFPVLPGIVLKLAVAAYVGVIALMAAQALGRATVLQDSASRWVGAGACIFMASDTLIAVNRFLQPVPMAPLWILLTYYLAQALIVHHAQPPLGSAAPSRSPAAPPTAAAS